MLRPLIPADLDQVMVLAAEMHASGVYADYPLYAEQARYILSELIADHDTFTMGALKGDELIGAYIGEIVPDLWVKVRVAVDHAFYVAEAHRGGTAGIRLLQAFEQWAAQQGADVIRPVVYAGVDNEGVSNMMTRLGYANAGTVFKRGTGQCA